MNRRQILSGVAAVGLSALIAAGCGDNGGGNGGGDGGNEFDGNVKIGAIVPLTGDLAAFGEAGNNALELAIDQINEAAKEAGLEGEAELVVEDGETAEAAGRAAAEKLTRSDDVSCIVGDWASSSTISVAESVTIDAGVPLISPASTAAEITELEDDNTVFRTVPSDALQAKLLAEAISEDLGGEGSVTVSARNNAYGVGLVEAFEPAAEELGLTVNEPILTDPDAPQVESEARQIVAGDADAYLLIDYPEAFQQLGPALVRTGDWDPAKTWVSDGLKDVGLPKSAGEEATEGMRGTAPTSKAAPAGDEFDELWNENDSGDRQTYDADNFDAAIACYLAAVAAGSGDPDELKEKLSEVTSPPGEKLTFQDLDKAIQMLQDGDDIDYEGASGPINWDENGDPSSADYEIFQYKGGKLETLEVRPYSEDGAEDEGTTTTGTVNTTEDAGGTATTGDTATDEESDEA